MQSIGNVFIESQLARNLWIASGSVSRIPSAAPLHGRRSKWLAPNLLTHGPNTSSSSEIVSEEWTGSHRLLLVTKCAIDGDIAKAAMVGHFAMVSDFRLGLRIVRRLPVGKAKTLKSGGGRV